MVMVRYRPRLFTVGAFSPQIYRVFTITLSMYYLINLSKLTINGI